MTEGAPGRGAGPPRPDDAPPPIPSGGGAACPITVIGSPSPGLRRNGVRWTDVRLQTSVPSATTTTSPVTRTRSPSTAACSVLGRPISAPCPTVSSCTPARSATYASSGPTAEPVAGSSSVPASPMKKLRALPAPSCESTAATYTQIAPSSSSSAGRSVSSARARASAATSRTGVTTCGTPVETSCGGHAGFASAGLQPDGCEDARRIELGAEDDGVLQHGRAGVDAVERHVDRLQARVRLLDVARLGPRRARGPRRPRCRATGGRRTAARRGG